MSSINWVHYVLLPGLIIILIVLVGIAIQKIRTFLKSPAVDDPIKADGWQFEGHPRDAMRSLWWMGAGFSLVVVAAGLVLLVGKEGRGPVGAFIAIVIGPIFGSAMFLGGFAMMPITALRFRMYKWLLLWVVIGILVGVGGAGLAYVISSM